MVLKPAAAIRPPSNKARIYSEAAFRRKLRSLPSFPYSNIFSGAVRKKAEIAERARACEDCNFPRPRKFHCMSCAIAAAAVSPKKSVRCCLSLSSPPPPPPPPGDLQTYSARADRRSSREKSHSPKARKGKSSLLSPSSTSSDGHIVVRMARKGRKGKGGADVLSVGGLDANSACIEVRE